MNPKSNLNLNKWKIVIAEDHTILREGLKAMLATSDDFSCIGEAHDGKEAIKIVGKLSPDIILMDLSMPNTNGTDAIRTIKRRYENVKIVVLTVHKAEEYIRASLEAGADAYMLKDDTQADLMTALQNVLAGKTYLSPTICGKVVNGYLESSSVNLGDINHRERSWDILTQREREVIKLIAEGSKNREIAIYLSISPKTVEKHRSNLMKKLRLTNIQAITTFALENGLITT